MLPFLSLRLGVALCLTLICATQARYLNRAGNLALTTFGVVLLYALGADLLVTCPTLEIFYPWWLDSAVILPALFYRAVYRFTRPVGRMPAWSYVLFMPLPLATAVFLAEPFTGEVVATWMYVAEAVVFLGLGLLALVASRRLLVRHEVNTRSVTADVEEVDLKWLRTVLPAIFLLLFCGGIAIFLWEENSYWRLAADVGILLVLLYFIVHKVRERQIYTPAGAAFVEELEGWEEIRSPDIHSSSRPYPPPLLTGGEDPPAPAAAPEKLRAETEGERRSATPKERLTAAELTALSARLDALMATEKPYRERGVTLPTLAEKMALSSHDLSYLLNAHYGENFYGFVNGYRVRASQEMLRDPTHDHLTMEGLAAAVGFNSKTAFNVNFKRVTGQTPSKYRAGTR